jgi:hypothetical protein
MPVALSIEQILEIEKLLDKLIEVLSSLDDQISESEDRLIPDTNSSDTKFCVWRIFEEIKGEATNLDEIVIKIREWIEQLKAYAGIIE